VRSSIAIACLILAGDLLIFLKLVNTPIGP
jgi:hypothetical protein